MRIFGAPAGGVGGDGIHGRDSFARSAIFPPNGGAGGGRTLCAAADPAANATMTVKTQRCECNLIDMVILICAHSLRATKTEMIGSRAELSFPTRADHVPRAVLVGTEKRSAAMDLLRLARLGRIERRARPARIARNGARGHELCVVVRAIPVARPLPGIAGHVVEV